METLKERFLPISDPTTLYLTNNLKTAIGRVDYVLERRCGLTAIFGDVGVGKTSLLHFLHAKYKSNENYITVFVIASESQSGFAMLKQISSAFGLELKRTFYDQWKLLESWLIEQYHKGKNIVVFIDDAHKLRSKHLNIVRSLVNLEPFFQKVVQVVLVGRLELRKKLLLHRNRDLLSRMLAPSILTPLTLEETKEMIS